MSKDSDNSKNRENPEGIERIPKEAEGLEENFSKLMESYKCGCPNRDEHGCTDCMNMGIILDNPEIQCAFQYRQELQAVQAKLELLTKCDCNGHDKAFNNHCQATNDKLKAMSDGFDIMQKAYLDSHTKRVELEDKLKACEEERDRTVNGYAEEQLKLLGQITELEAERDEVAGNYWKVVEQRNTLERIAREFIEYGDEYTRSETLKKIDELSKDPN